MDRQSLKMSSCYCNSGKEFKECCHPFLIGKEKAPTAEKLMRSRYSAYVTHNVDYLVATTLPSERIYYSKEDILTWATSNRWLKLEVIGATEKTVTFKAYFTDSNGEDQVHNEHSSFVFKDGNWYYAKGEFFE